MLHGTYYFGNRRVACRSVYCTTCKSPQLAEGRRSLVVLHVAFVPLLPIGTKVRWFCSVCHREANAHRPSRPGLLVAGVVLAVGMIALGVSFLFSAGDKADAPGCIILGVGAAAGLIYLLSKQDYRSFVAGTKTVTPLRGDVCPYCRAPIFSGIIPHCRTCNIDIITE